MEEKKEFPKIGLVVIIGDKKYVVRDGNGRYSCDRCDLFNTKWCAHHPYKCNTEDDERFIYFEDVDFLFPEVRKKKTLELRCKTFLDKYHYRIYVAFWILVFIYFITLILGLWLR